MTLVVCPLSKVTEMIALHRPGRVISLLDPDWPFPELGSDYADRHLRLSFHDVNDAVALEIAPSITHVQEVIRFVEDWVGDDALLIHCRAGISRSTAAAFIIACLRNADRSELDIAVALREVSPLARPNLALVRHADREMGRNGRMVQAIKETGRGLPWIEVEENVPFVIPIKFND